MTETSPRPVEIFQDDSDFSLLFFGSVLLRWRRWIAALALVGGLFGIASGLIRSRLYVSTATFIPQGSESGGSSELAIAASQLGIRVPSSGSVWGPAVYVQLFRTRALLDPVALDTIAVAEEGGRRRSVADLLGVREPNSALRANMAVTALRGAIEAVPLTDLNAVKMSVISRWPSVSLALAEKLVSSVNQFNLETRKSQATAERKFVEMRAAEAERALRDAEDRLQAFLQGNRVYSNASELSFEHNRLEREVTLRQQVYSSLLVNREEARIREIRDIPVITVLDAPRLPLVGESRKTGQRAILGALAGAMLGVLVALLANGIRSARQAPSEAAREFFETLHEATPRLFRRGGR